VTSLFKGRPAALSVDAWDWGCHGPRGLRRTLTQTRPLEDAAVEHRLAAWDRHLAVANVSAAVRDVAPLIAAAPPAEYGNRLRGRQS